MNWKDFLIYAISTVILYFIVFYFVYGIFNLWGVYLPLWGYFLIAFVVFYLTFIFDDK